MGIEKGSQEVCALAEYKEKVISTRLVYEGRILNLRVDTVELPGGRTGTREVVEYQGAVAVVPLNENRELLMVRQYRHAAKRDLLEIPAGKIEAGEDPAVCARRELLEETGCGAADMVPLLHFFSTPGFTTEEMHVFVATGLIPGEQDLDDDEFIDVLAVPFEKALEMIKSGEICDAKSIAGILAANLEVGSGRLEV